MKYFSFITLTAVVLLFTFTSCEKCLTCSYTYTENGEDMIFRSQQCGSKDDLDSFESFVSTQATSRNAVPSCSQE